MRVTIDPEFKALIPPLAPEELQLLEQNIIQDGCRDPLVVWNGVLVDGHNRYEICTRNDIKFSFVERHFEDRRAAIVWIIRNQFGRRNLAPFTRAELALRLASVLEEEARERMTAGIGEDGSGGRGNKKNPVANLPQGFQTAEPKKPAPKVRQDLAKAAGVGERTMQDAKLIAENASEEIKQKLRENQVSIHRVAKDIRESKQREARKEKRMKSAETAKPDKRIIVGDFRLKSDSVANGSVSLIFTDPPYDKKASLMLPALGEFAAAKLAEGGSMLLYVGTTQIPAALDALRPHLRYWWTVACVHSGRRTVMREYGINAGWKAVLWFVKTTRDDNSVMVEDTMSGGEEKTHHDWQQSQSEAEYWIGKLCPKDGLVCDPFLGGGTTAAAAEALGREWVGFEIDEETATIAAGRVSK